MGLYRVSGWVEAPDGTTYRPLYFGDWWSACRVRDAILLTLTAGENYERR